MAARRDTFSIHTAREYCDPDIFMFKNKVARLTARGHGSNIRLQPYASRTRQVGQYTVSRKHCITPSRAVHCTTQYTISRQVGQYTVSRSTLSHATLSNSCFQKIFTTIDGCIIVPRHTLSRCQTSGLRPRGACHLWQRNHALPD